MAMMSNMAATDWWSQYWQSQVAPEPLKHRLFGLRYAVHVRYTLDFEVLLPKNAKYFIDNFFVDVDSMLK